MSMSWRKRAEHLAPAGTRGVAPLRRERRPRSARGIGAALGVIALLAGAVGVTVAQLAATSSGAATSPGILTGPGQGGGPDVHAFTGAGAPTSPNGYAYDGAFFGGVRVASGDFNGDGIDDIVTGAGPGGGPHVKVFDGATTTNFTNTPLGSAFAFDGSFHGGVFVAAGDVNGDGVADLVVGAGPGATPEVKVVSGKDNSILADFLAFQPTYVGGVTVAVGDVNGDGKADIITGSATSDSVVDVFNGANAVNGATSLPTLASFHAYDLSFQGGVFVGAGDINGDGKADVITGAGPGGGPHVKVFNITAANFDTNPIASFFAYEDGFHAGVRVAGSDTNGDGVDDIITGPGPGGGPLVKVFDGKQRATLSSTTPLSSFYAYPPGFVGGVYVAGHSIAASGALKVNSTSPSSMGAGATNKDVIVNGSGFQSGSTVAFSGSGITVNGTPTVQDGGHIKVNITIAGNAATGARDVTVTRTDSQSAKCTGCFTVTAAPTVTSITPNTGAQGSTINNVNIGGTGFVNGATPSFSGSGLSVSNVTFNSATQITATVTIDSSAAVGTRDVIVTNPDGGSGKFANGFGVTAGPQITSTSPNSVTPDSANPVNKDITITGTGFATGAAASFSGTGITVNSTDFTDAQHVVAHITVAPGTAHGPRTVTVTNPNNGGAGSCAGCFSIGPEPTVMSISPNQGGQGAVFSAANATPNPVVIKGTNFNSNTTVVFALGSSSETTNGMNVSNITSPDASTLSFNLQIASNASTGPRDLQVTNAGGGVTIPGAFTVDAAPTVNNATPSSLGAGASNQNVVIGGTGFQNPANVSMGAGITINKITVTDPTHITVNVSVDPGAANGARTIFVTNADGGSGSCAGCFTVNAAPTVAQTSSDAGNTQKPASRAAGSPAADIYVNGTGFVSSSVVTFSGSGVKVNSTTFTSASQLKVNITVDSTAAPGARDVTVTNPDGGAGSCVSTAQTSCFNVVAAPQVNTANPNSLNPGDSGKTVTLKGTGFQPVPPASGPPTVTFSGSGVTFTGPPVVTDANTITLNGVAVASGAAAGPRDITVTNVDGGSAVCKGCFSVGATPSISSVSPDHRAVGSPAQDIKLKGTNFKSSSIVTFSKSGINVSNPHLDGSDASNSTFIVTVSVAGNATPGASDITVDNGGGVTGGCTGCFTVTAAPTIASLNPPSATRAASPVTLNVTVTGANFEQGGAIVFSKSGSQTGITVNSTTFNSSTSMTANITVATNAPTGAWDVVEFNPDGGTAVCSGCFTVN